MFAEDVGLLPNGALHATAGRRARNVAELPAHGRGALAHHGHGRLLGGAARADAPLQRRALRATPPRCRWTRDQLQLLQRGGAGRLARRRAGDLRHAAGSARWTRSSATSWARTTPRAPMSSGWCCRPWSSRCATSGTAVKAAALLLAEQGRATRRWPRSRTFQRRLASVRVLDPACGTGNFLYVTLEHLKRLEGEVLQVRRQLGAGADAAGDGGRRRYARSSSSASRSTRRRGRSPSWCCGSASCNGTSAPAATCGLPEPILRDLHNIECRDAVLAWDAVEPLLDAAGQPVTRWDGRTTKPHPVTGEQVPDETARVPVYRYLNPRPARVAAGRLCRGQPAVYRHGADARRAGRRLRRGRSARPTPTCPTPPTTSCSGGTRPPSWCAAARCSALASSPPTACARPSTAACWSITWQAEPPLSLLFAIPDHPWVDSRRRRGGADRHDGGQGWPRSRTVAASRRQSAGQNETMEITLARASRHRSCRT